MSSRACTYDEVFEHEITLLPIKPVIDEVANEAVLQSVQLVKVLFTRMLIERGVQQHSGAVIPEGSRQPSVPFPQLLRA